MKSARSWALTTVHGRATLLLCLLFALQVGIALAAWRIESQALAMMNRAEVTDRVQLDVQHLVVGMQDQEIGLTGYVNTADPTFRDNFRFGRSEVKGAWPVLVADARQLGLAGQLAPVRQAVDFWQSWADQREQVVVATHRPSLDPESTRLGDALFDHFANQVSTYNQLASVRAHQAHALAQALAFQLLTASLGAAVGAAVLTVVAAVSLALGLRPTTRLAIVAHRLARGEPASVPYVQRGDEVGRLARALAAYRDAEARSRATFQRAPIGMVTVGLDGRVWDSNPALRRMLGCTADEMRGQSFADIVRSGEGMDGVTVQERRFPRSDGTSFWAQVTTAPVDDAEGHADYLVAMIEDITERKEKMENAARVQRELLPMTTPEVAGYEVFGACLTAEEVGGDFFDWVDGHRGTLTITLGDVMGKGMAAALLMATLRSALRAGARLPTTAEAVQTAADSMAQNLDGADAFITLFHARLHVHTGLITYVDAGHGLAFVLDPAGEARRLGATAPPLGAVDHQHYPQATTTLEPGGSLVVFSDGMLEIDEELADAARTASLARGGAGARAIGERLLGQAAGIEKLHDDLTVMVVHRAPPGD